MITTLLFDLGGTLHSVSRSEETRLRFAERVLRMLREQGAELGVSPRELSELLQKNGEIYKHESEETLRELPSVRIGKMFRVSEAQLKTYMDSQSVGAPASGENARVCSRCGKKYYSELSITGKCRVCGAPLCKACIENDKAELCEIHEKDNNKKEEKHV